MKTKEMTHRTNRTSWMLWLTRAVMAMALALAGTFCIPAAAEAAETTGTLTDTDGDGEVLSWSYNDESYTLTISGTGELGKQLSGSAFEGLTIKKIVFQSCKVIGSMNSAFQDFEKLEGVDFSGLDTSKVDDMGGMFAGCSSLKSLDLSKFDTSNVTNMDSMFVSCAAMTDVDVSSFKTGNVTSMEGMFALCSSLTSLDLSGFNTEKVTTMEGMFAYCSALTSLDLSGFNTSNVTTMDEMFTECTNLKSLKTPATMGTVTATLPENLVDSEGNSVTSMAANMTVTQKGEETNKNPNQYDSPGNLTWGENYTAVWSIPATVKDAQVTCTLFKEDGTQVMGHQNIALDTVYFIWTDYILDSGNYYFTVQIMPLSGDTTHEASEIVKSELLTYTRPEKELAAVTAQWSSEAPGTVVFPAVEGANGYYVSLWVENENGQFMENWMRTIAAPVGQMNVTVDWSSTIMANGFGNYCVYVRALSPNIATTANARRGTASETFEYKEAEPTPEISPLPLVDAVKFVPYVEPAVKGVPEGYVCVIAAGSLPQNLAITADGTLYGIPSTVGTYNFTIAVNDSKGTEVGRADYELVVLQNSDENVAMKTDAGYEISEEVTGFKPGQETEQTLVSQGDFSEFTNVYIDAVMLTPNVDYTAESGSTRITIKSQTFSKFNQVGTHTIAVQFVKPKTNSINFAVQNYEINGTGNANDNTNNTNSGSNNSSNNTDSNSGSNESAPDTGWSNVYVPVVTVNEAIYYTVVKGDTLNKIARANGITLAQLLAWNPQIKNPNLIFPGEQVVVGYRNGVAVSAADPVGGESYDVVKKGDCLYVIARRNKVTLSEIVALNPELAKQKYIYPGQQVRVR